MKLLDTIAQAATYLDYTHLSEGQAVKQYKIDLDLATYLAAFNGYNECIQSHSKLIEHIGLDDDQILSLNHHYQLESIDYVAEFIALDNQLQTNGV
jgi:hypothetical protein